MALIRKQNSEGLFERETKRAIIARCELYTIDTDKSRFLTRKTNPHQLEWIREYIDQPLKIKKINFDKMNIWEIIGNLLDGYVKNPLNNSVNYQQLLQILIMVAENYL